MDEAACQALAGAAKDEALPQLMGIEVVSVAPGHAVARMAATEAMTNVFGTVHGGAICALLDEAFEMACNSHGTVAVALNVSVSFVAPAYPGDTLLAEAREIDCGPRVGTYDIRCSKEDGTPVASCHALAYRKRDPLPFTTA